MRIAHFYNSETEEMTTRESSIGFFNGIANQFPINSLMVKNDIATYQTWKVIKNTNIRGGSKYAIPVSYTL